MQDVREALAQMHGIAGMERRVFIPEIHRKNKCHKIFMYLVFIQYDIFPCIMPKLLLIGAVFNFPKDLVFPVCILEPADISGRKNGFAVPVLERVRAVLMVHHAENINPVRKVNQPCHVPVVIPNGSRVILCIAMVVVKDDVRIFRKGRKILEQKVSEHRMFHRIIHVKA